MTGPSRPLGARPGARLRSRWTIWPSCWLRRTSTSSRSSHVSSHMSGSRGSVRPRTPSQAPLAHEIIAGSRSTTSSGSTACSVLATRLTPNSRTHPADRNRAIQSRRSGSPGRRGPGRRGDQLVRQRGGRGHEPLHVGDLPVGAEVVRPPQVHRRDRRRRSRPPFAPEVVAVGGRRQVGEVDAPGLLLPPDADAHHRGLGPAWALARLRRWRGIHRRGPVAGTGGLPGSLRHGNERLDHGEAGRLGWGLLRGRPDRLSGGRGIERRVELVPGRLTREERVPALLVGLEGAGIALVILGLACPQEVSSLPDRHGRPSSQADGGPVRPPTHRRLGRRAEPEGSGRLSSAVRRP